MSSIDRTGLGEGRLRKSLVVIERGRSPEKMHLNYPFTLTMEYEGKSKT